MARPGLLQHRKFVRLARLLGSDALALGHLEIIWQAAYQSGDPGLGTAADLEYLARWKGDTGALANSLLLAGFIDAIPGTDDFAIHDLLDHAPDYVRRRMEREHERTVKAKNLHEIRAKSGRKGGQSKASKSPPAGKQMTVTDRSVTDVCYSPGVANGATPSPSPSPNKPPNPPAGGGDEIPPDKAKRSRSKKPPNPVHAEAVKIFCDAWSESRGAKYPFADGKDASAVGWCLGHLGNDLGRWRDVVRRYFATADEFLARNGYSLAILRARFGGLIVDPPPAVSRSSADDFDVLCPTLPTYDEMKSQLDDLGHKFEEPPE